MTEANGCKHVFKKLRIIACAVLFCVSFVNTLFAQCVVQSNNYACVDEPFSFAIQSSGTVTGVAWTFGDGNTSNLTNPFHRFSSAGTYKVSAKVTLSGGGTCDTFKNITIYSPPNVRLYLDKSSAYCLSQNKVCLFDTSNSGNSGVNITDRTILWGDGGKTDTKNPKLGSSACYTYTREGKYTLTTELVNDKGCKAKQEISIEILKDFIPKFSSFLAAKDCDSQQYVFNVDTSLFKFAADLQSLEYDFKDGNKLKTYLHYAERHHFTKTGKFDVTLTATFKNGCVTTYTQSVDIQLDRIDIDHSKVFAKRCFPLSFEFNHPIVTGTTTTYLWTALDTAFEPVDYFGSSRNANFYPDTPGKYYISLEIGRNGCTSLMQFDSIESVGVKAKAMILNGSQCAPTDTVYFCNKSIIYGSNDISYIWNFVDSTAQKCTTDTKNGLYVDDNCNFSKDFNGKHFYHNQKCDSLWLIATDNENGCIDSIEYDVLIGKPDLTEFKWKPMKMCMGILPGYGALFTLKSCFGNLKINLDSACHRDSFIDYIGVGQYSALCDTSRWVTLGLAASTGDNKIYRSCDTSDFYIDNSKVCNDTVWHHNIYRLDPFPFSSYKYTSVGCVPSTLSGSIFLRKQPNVRKIYFDWDDGNYDTLDIAIGTDSLPNFSYTYRKSGQYYPVVTLETDSGCQDYQRVYRPVGFYNDYRYDDLICPGTTIKFNDTITYWEDTIQWWRSKDKKLNEKILWDWDGASGPLTGTEPRARFDTAGTYNVRMISLNSAGCADTVIKKIVVSDVVAGIRDIHKKIICEDILQLLDSSFAMKNPRDSLILYYWDFGDGKTPSYLKHPFHYYSTIGKFEVTHIVENTLGCRDTATTTIEIEGPLPQFDIVSDTVGCAPFTAEFKNNSQRASEFIWYFGDPSSGANTLSTKSKANVTFTYNKPGTYYIYLYGGDSVVNHDNGGKMYFCNQVFPDTNAFPRNFRRIIVLPKPNVDFKIDGSLCLNSELVLTDKSDSIYSYYRWFWGQDSTTGTDSIQKIIVSDTGSLSITYKPIYTPNGPYQRSCFDTITKKVPVLSNDLEFSFQKEEICPTFNFTAAVKPGSSLVWDFGHPSSGSLNTATGLEVKHTFAPEKGQFLVCVRSTTPEGCVDTACRTVSSEHNFVLSIPNVITPNGDGINDTYVIDVEGEDFYDLEIFNRWGESVYKSSTDYLEDSPLNWDGKVQGTLKKVPQGTYFYVFRFKEGCIPDAEIETYNGTITVIY